MTAISTQDTTPEKLQGVDLFWLGHAAFRLTSPEDKIVYIDPWLENPKSPLQVDQVAGADVIILTHGHFDHVGNTVEIAGKTGATVICPVEVGHYLTAQGLSRDQVVGMNIGGTVRQAGMEFTMVFAAHSSGITGEDGVIPGGNPAGMVITFENGFTVYHTGDTDFFGDMQYIREFHEPDLMLLCIGDHFTMGPRKAAKSIETVRPSYALPMHYGTFPLLTGTPGDLLENLSKEYRERVIVAEPGAPVQ